MGFKPMTFQPALQTTLSLQPRRFVVLSAGVRKGQLLSQDTSFHVQVMCEKGSYLSICCPFSMHEERRTSFTGHLISCAGNVREGWLPGFEPSSFAGVGCAGRGHLCSSCSLQLCDTIRRLRHHFWTPWSRQKVLRRWRHHRHSLQDQKASETKSIVLASLLSS